MNREAIDTWLARSILGIVIVLLLFGPLAWGAVRPTEFVVIEWLMVGIVSLWIIRLWMLPRFRFLLPPTAWAILPFVVYAVWRYRTADIEYLARQEFIQVVIAALLFLAIVNNLYSQTSLRIIAISLVALGTVLAMYGIYQWLTGSQRVWWLWRPGYEGRGSGTYVCPNHLAGFLEMVFPLAVTFTVLRGFSLIPRVLFAYASLVMLVGIAGTGSRAGWLSAGVAVLILLLVLIRNKSLRWGALVLMLAVCGTGTLLYSRVLKPRIYPQGTDRQFDDIRFRLWTSAKQMWKDNPAFGVGPDHFDSRYRGYRIAHWSVQPRPERAHNDYLNTLADWGLVGLVLIMTPLVIAGIGITRSWKNLYRSGETAGNRTALVLGASIGLAALLVHSFFDFNMHIPANAFLATALLAIITAHWRFATKDFWVTVRWPLRIGATLALGGASYYLGVQSWQHTSEVVALNQAAQAQTSQDRITALEKAFRIDPKNFMTAYALGEEFHARAGRGDDDYKEMASQAIQWFQRASKLNRWDPRAHIQIGICLDWLSRPAEAEIEFSKALALDPNHWYTRGMMGWHYFQIENFEEARRWMERSLEVEGARNTLAYTILDKAKKRLSGHLESNPALHSLPELR